MNSLVTFGWTPQHQTSWDSLSLHDLQPARVVADFGTSLKLAIPEIITAELSGKLAHYSERDDTPKVGDWVAVRISPNGTATVESVVLRRNEIARKVTGKRALKQIIAANVDIAFVLVALDNDFSIERLRRFLFQLSSNKVDAVIVLNKSDKTDDIQSYVDQLQQFNQPIIVSAALYDSGVEEIAAYIQPAQTAILLGSSGVGKSTLTNKLLGRDAQQTNEVRASDDSGKHTTVHRELFLLPNEGILIDSPGIRELQLWGSEEELDENFDDVAALAAQCKYTTCQHGSEEGCAIRPALQSGALDEKHYRNYLKMKKELSSLAEKKIVRARLENARPYRQKNKNASARRHDALNEDY